MKVPITKLSHHPKNEEIYQLSDIEDLMESISEVGLLQPLIINKKYQVLSGNRRFESIKRLGWKEVEVEFSTSDKEEELLLIHHNKQRVKSYSELLNEYHTLKSHYLVGQGRRTDLTSVQMNKGSNGRDEVSQKLGISSSRLGKLLFIEKIDSDLIDLLDKGDISLNQGYLQSKRIQKEREYLNGSERLPQPIQPNTENWRFYQKSSDNLSELMDGEVQTIFTSPPYWNKRLYTHEGGLGNEKTSDEYVERLVNHMKDWWRVLNDRGSFFLNIGDTFYNGNLQNVPHKVCIGLQSKGWILRNTIIWSKTNPKPSSSKTNLTPSYEFIFHFVKSMDYKYNRLTLPIESNSSTSPPRHRNTKGRTPKTLSPYFKDSKGKNLPDYWDEEIIRTSVSNNQRHNIEHPAPFPINLPIVPILQTTVEGDLVLDPFCGSGTTGKVSNSIGRRFVGMDVVLI